ncbi:MAG: hypothetical protein AMXMBFR6_22690 [Betaproteobacteria bacterium]
MRIYSIAITVVASFLSASSSTPFIKQEPKSLAPVVVDMHFGALLGTGWLGNKVEPGNYINTVTLTPAKRGSFEVDVKDTAWLREGMLICAYDEGGEYYSHVVTKITGNRLQLDRPLESTIADGAPIYNFYMNDAHANDCGYRAIADDAIRQFKLGKRLEYPVQPARWESLGGALIAPEKTNSYTNPGGRHDGDEALRVDALASGQGVVSGVFALQKGKHVTSLVVNPGEGTADNPSKAIISVEMETASGTRKLAEQAILGTGRTMAVNLRYDLPTDGNVKIRAATQNEKGATFQVGAVRNFRVVEEFNTADFANRKHVLLGDSWFSWPAITKHLQERFPQATFINKGIGGNKASQLILRFGSDVVTQHPDYVWVMSGTNDYYDPEKLGQQRFQQYISELKILTAAIGAQLIVFTPSVGDITYTAPGMSEQLGNSRRFALNTKYFDNVSVPAPTKESQDDGKVAKAK